MPRKIFLPLYKAGGLNPSPPLIPIVFYARKLDSALFSTQGCLTRSKLHNRFLVTWRDFLRLQSVTKRDKKEGQKTFPQRNLSDLADLKTARSAINKIVAIPVDVKSNYVPSSPFHPFAGFCVVAVREEERIQNVRRKRNIRSKVEEEMWEVRCWRKVLRDVELALEQAKKSWRR